MSAEAYRRAGVDLDAASAATSMIRDLAASATRPEVIQGVGGFAGLFRISEDRLLAAATDGVGTKLEIARQLGRLDTVGIDLVAMCANDVVCVGAEPLFFLDYLAAGRVVPEEVAAIVAGVAEGCRLAGCALLGGETAEHPGVMEVGQFDLAGFCVGSVAEEDLLGPQRVRTGDMLLGLRSSGLHANGFSLVRSILEHQDLLATPEGLSRPLGEELLRATVIYVPAVLAAARTGAVRSVAHVTGGGLLENLPRALPPGLGAEVERSAWNPHPVFAYLQGLGALEDEEMQRTFNLGIGMVLVVAPEGAEHVAGVVGALGFESVRMGAVSPSPGVRLG